MGRSIIETPELSTLSGETKIVAAKRLWARQNYRDHPERYRRYALKHHYKSKYGITIEQKKERIQSQGGKCANPRCGATTPGGRYNWHTDHDHETGQLRGELCHHCNTALGSLERNPDRVLGLIEYLAFWRKQDENRKTISQATS